MWKGFLTTLGTSILQPMRTLLEKPTPNYDVNVTPVPAAVSKRKLLLSLLPSFFVLAYPLLTFSSHAPLLAAWLFAWPWVGMSLIFTTSERSRRAPGLCYRTPSRVGHSPARSRLHFAESADSAGSPVPKRSRHTPRDAPRRHTTRFDCSRPQ